MKRDPTPPVDAAPSPAALALLHGRIVDVKTGAVVHLLREKKPLAELMDPAGAYTLDADHKLRAWDVATGALRWEEPTKFARELRLDKSFVYLAEPSGIEVRGREDASKISWVPWHHGVRGEMRVLREHVVFASFGVEVFNARGGPARARRVTPAIADLIEDGTLGLSLRDDEVCYATSDPAGFRVECIDLDANVSRTASVPLARPSDPSGTYFSLRYLSRHHLVLGTWSAGFSKTRRSAVVRLSDVAVTIIEDEVAAAVERPDGTLEGLLVMGPEVRLLTPAGATRWKHRMTDPEEFAAVALVDERLVIAGFNAIATGVQVLALGLSDGKQLWQGVTKLPPIAHSRYHNKVTLEALGDAVILRGDESSVDHVHVYDSKTGALRFSDAQ